MIAVVTYCLLIATMGFMIVGVNGPQFAYFAGRLDKPGYLRAAMQAYGAVEFIAHTGTKARIYAVENEARAYAPIRSPFRRCGARRQCHVRPTRSRPRRQNDADYLILPENGAVPEQRCNSSGGPERVYRDAYFSVYHLAR